VCRILEGRFPTLEVRRSKVRATRPINADTHCTPYLLNAKAYELNAYHWHTQANTNVVYVCGSYNCSAVLSIMIYQMYLIGARGTLLL